MTEEKRWFSFYSLVFTNTIMASDERSFAKEVTHPIDHELGKANHTAVLVLKCPCETLIRILIRPPSTSNLPIPMTHASQCLQSFVLVRFDLTRSYLKATALQLHSFRTQLHPCYFNNQESSRFHVLLSTRELVSNKQ